MASGGPNSSSPPSWAEIVAAVKNRPNQTPSPLVEGPVLRKLKASTSEFIRLDGDAMARARLRIQHSLLGKFFGKPPPFDQVKSILQSKWNDIGEISISDLPNGYLLFRCESFEISQKILFDGPWAVNGAILQLAPWKPFFEPAFTKLSSAVIWVQLHNLPVEFWDGETLETISSSLGRLLKIDEFTLSMSRSRYARVCLEIDLSKPLKQGFWLGDDENRVFVVVLYEKLPTFCYHCGMVGHGSNLCSRRSSRNLNRPLSPPSHVQGEPNGMEIREDSVSQNNGMEARDGAMPPLHDDSLSESADTDFGPWMLVSRRRGRGGGRGGAGGGAGNPASREAHVRPTVDDPKVWPRFGNSRSPRGGFSSRGRGGFSGERSNAFTHIPVQEAGITADLTPVPVLDMDLSMALVPTEKRDVGSLNNPDPVPCPNPSVSSKKKMKQPCQTHSLPPILRTSDDPPARSNLAPPPPSHALAIVQVTGALNPSPLLENSDLSMSDSGEEETDEDDSDCAMSEYDDPEEPDDSMTLVQYTNGLRKEALDRHDPQSSSSLHKKGRLDIDGAATQGQGPSL
ncbi:uncharacterized protein LOC120274516 [Dioscorea cayenensis subsp. rotundata]|uniref:Uncharacterized protein LOC120274516 n=1 Tax=Dioscorea cayennensis subsp. rotundata TaxID=55577 RepID=A0AB40CDY8_DIOCR|nr:uncharacterized protein LOC120274516 [Dioscorea cayenensis subsp. rotundata]